jgi:hypothetical protein
LLLLKGDEGASSSSGSSCWMLLIEMLKTRDSGSGRCCWVSLLHVMRPLKPRQHQQLVHLPCMSHVRCWLFQLLDDAL